MSSFGQFLHDELVKGKAFAQKVLADFGGVATAIDSAAPTVEGITALFYPPAVNMEKAFVALMDVAAAAVKADSAVAADGTVTLHLSPDVVAQVKAVVAAGDAAYQAVKNKGA
jgi:hypothetical protein